MNPESARLHYELRDALAPLQATHPRTRGGGVALIVEGGHEAGYQLSTATEGYFGTITYALRNNELIKSYGLNMRAVAEIPPTAHAFQKLADLAESLEPLIAQFIESENGEKNNG